MSVFNSGAYFGPAIGSLTIGALIAAVGWRPAFYLCAAVGFVWLAFWLARYHLPEHTQWLESGERELILRERNAGVEMPKEAALGLRGLATAPTLWALMLTQGWAKSTRSTCFSPGCPTICRRRKAFRSWPARER